MHIADVAQYVTEGDDIDLEAYRRGTSVYYPERAIPMLPERLSNGLCSLRPGVPRLAMSVFLDIGRDGQILARRFTNSPRATKRTRGSVSASGFMNNKRSTEYSAIARIACQRRSGPALAP